MEALLGCVRGILCVQQYRSTASTGRVRGCLAVFRKAGRNGATKAPLKTKGYRRHFDSLGRQRNWNYGHHVCSDICGGITEWGARFPSQGNKLSRT